MPTGCPLWAGLQIPALLAHMGSSEGPSGTLSVQLPDVRRLSPHLYSHHTYFCFTSGASTLQSLSARFCLLTGQILREGISKICSSFLFLIENVKHWVEYMLKSVLVRTANTQQAILMMVLD